MEMVILQASLNCNELLLILFHYTFMYFYVLNNLSLCIIINIYFGFIDYS